MPTTRKIVGAAVYGDLSDASGAVNFTPQTILTFDGEVILPAPITVRVVDGAFEIDLPVTDQAGYQPEGWVWKSEELWTGGRTFFFELPSADLSPIDYTALVPATSLADPYAAHTHPELLVVGPKGDTGEIDVGTVTVVNPDQSPTVTNSGTTTDAVLDFDLPRAASVTIGTVTTIDNDQSPAVSDVGTNGDVVLDFDLPQAKDVTLGTITTVNPDQSPAVTDSGDVNGVVLDFDIPRAASVTVGTVTPVDNDQSPAVSDSGVDGDVVLDFNLPQAKDVTLGTTTVVNPDQNPAVSDSGDVNGAVLDFDLPRAPTFTVGTVTTVTPADPADVTDVGTNGDIVLDFDIPQGEAAEVNIGTVTVVNPDQNPNVTNSGTNVDAVLDFDLPRAASVTLGMVTTIDSNVSPSVADSGIDGDVVLDFDLPQAKDLTLGTVTVVNPDQNPAITDSGDVNGAVYDFDLPRAPTFTVGTVTTGAPGSAATVADTGTDGDIVLDFSIPEGDPGGEAFFGQISRQTDGTVAVAASGTYYAIDLAGTFDLYNAYGVIEGTLEDLALKNDTEETLLFTVIGSVDATAVNNELLGIKLAVDGVPIDASECRANTGTNNYAKLLSQWMVELAPDEEVSLHIANHTAAQNITVKRAKLVAFTSGRQGDDGAPGIVISGTEPVDTDVLWADTSEPGDAVIPIGGTTGQVLAKTTGSDYDTEWVDRVSSPDVTSIEVLTESEYDALDPVDPNVLYVVVEDVGS